MITLEQLMLDQCPTMMLLVDPVSLQIMKANHFAGQRLGYSTEALQAMSITDVESSLTDVFYWEDVRNGQYQDIEQQEGLYQCADGSMLSVTKNIRAIEHDGCPLMLVLARLFEMQETESELATALYVAAMRMALYTWGLGFLRILLLPKGLVSRHFRWPVQRTALLYKRVVRLEQTFLPASFLVVLAVQLYPRDMGGALASLGMIIVLLSLAQFFRHLPQFAQGKIKVQGNVMLATKLQSLFG